MHDMQDAAPIPNEGELDVLAERFFSQPPAAWESAHDSAHDDWQPEPMSSIERVAMLTTAAPAMAMLAVAVTLLSDLLLIAVPRPSAQPIEAPHAHVAAGLLLSNGDVATREDRAKNLALSAPARGLAVAPAPVPALVTQPQAAISQAAVAARPSAASPRRRARKHDAGAKRARQLLDAGDAKAARDIARDVVRRLPARAEGYIVLAAALDELGDRAGRNATFGECAKLATDPLASACRSLARQR
jgi:hypothetical protein